jgi:uncharacterized protein YegL
MDENRSLQEPYIDVEFAANPEPRCPCILLLDSSASMSGSPIQELNEGLRALKQDLVADTMAAKRVELAVITFGPVEVVTEFCTPDLYNPPSLIANNNTPMGQAIELAFEKLESRKKNYRDNGISYYRPWIFLITDGEPTDQWQNAAALVHRSEEQKAAAVVSVGVSGANIAQIQQKALTKPLSLQGRKISQEF